MLNFERTSSVGVCSVEKKQKRGKNSVGQAAGGNI
jgi:hypothetical protein